MTDTISTIEKGEGRMSVENPATQLDPEQRASLERRYAADWKHMGATALDAEAVSDETLLSVMGVAGIGADPSGLDKNIRTTGDN